LYKKFRTFAFEESPLLCPQNVRTGQTLSSHDCGRLLAYRQPLYSHSTVA